ncbi:MAG: hypothetical protein ABFD79_02800 [Phycisphaerales bacterium]
MIKAATEFVETSPDNYISAEIAISEDMVGLELFEAPILGFAAGMMIILINLRIQAFIND